MDDTWLTHDSFAPLVGSSFAATTEDGTLELTLVSADDAGIPGGTSPDGRTRTQFSIEFTGPVDKPLTQGAYELTCDALGTQSIFLVPVQVDADKAYYEAVFA